MIEFSNKIELNLAGYYKKNVVNYTNLPSFFLNESSTDAILYLEEVDFFKTDNQKIFKIKELDLEIENFILYLGDSILQGIYRYNLEINGNSVFSNIFKVVECSNNLRHQLIGGLLKFNNNKNFEFLQKGYFINKSLLKFDKLNFYFDFFEDINYIESTLYQISEEKLQIKEIEFFKEININIQNIGRKVFLDIELLQKGLFFLELKINNFEYNSEIFEICPRSCGNFNFNDMSCLQFNDNLFFDFN